ncbi:MAG: glycosyl transferase family 1 [Gemmatimonadales bacterium]|nr:MAG: glycosyl transferase family 1 [Gemmatimonadales bacterium]
MRILAVNWLDRANPQAGGAELHFFEIFRRLVARGHEVTLICSGFPGGAGRDVIDGIRIRRYGRRYSFALRGRPAIREALKEANFDVLVEDINKLPLYTPTLTRLPVYAVVPHLFGLTAFREVSWPVAAAVALAELPLPWVYRRAEFHAISESTKLDLIRRGVAAERIRVIYPGVDCEWYTPGPGARAGEPTFLYLGRLKRYKGVATAVEAMAILRRRGVEARLLVAGEGDDRRQLERLVRKLGLTEVVTFTGFVSEERKREMMRLAWAVVLPSAKEGWGITNVEAAACGTPALAADRPGLRESVRDGVTGMLFPFGDAGSLAAAMARLAEDRDLVERMGRAARKFAERFSWDRAALETEEHLQLTIDAARRGRRRDG